MSKTVLSKFKQPLKECPFCGSTNVRLTGPESVADGREYEVSLTCEECDCFMPLRVSYRSYSRDTYPDKMIEPLFLKWNQRSGFKITVELR